MRTMVICKLMLRSVVYFVFIFYNTAITAAQSGNPADATTSGEQAITLVIDWIGSNPKIAAIILASTLLVIAWLTILAIQPIRLLSIYRIFRIKSEIPVLKYFILRGEFIRDFFLLRRRVLDAWVAQHLVSAKSHFERIDKVRVRSVYVGIPIEIDGTLVSLPSAGSFDQAFRTPTTRILITGKGGYGKSTLALQIALWSMGAGGSQYGNPKLAVLVAGNVATEGLSPFEAIVSTVAAYLREAIEETRDLTDDFAERLLRTGRVLVIVDGYSELDDTTRHLFDPGKHRRFPIARLVYTGRPTRRIENLVPSVTVQCLGISGDQISAFVDAYLRQSAKREDFLDADLFSDCERLAEMMLGREVTALLATIYVDLMVAQADGSQLTMPRTVVECMLDYTHYLCRGRDQDSLTPAQRENIRLLVKAACLAARECVLPDFTAGNVNRVRLEAALEKLGGARIVDGLETTANIIETSDRRGETLHFVLDPLAEYLAAMQLCSDFGNNEDDWKRFLDEAVDRSEPDVLQPFVNALRDCIQVQTEQTPVPKRIIERLERLSGLQDDEILEALRLRRIRRLANTLERRDANDADRRFAAEEIRLYGPDAHTAAGPLIRCFRETEDVDVRISIAQALERIQPRGPEATAALTDLLAVAIPTDHPSGSYVREPVERTLAGMAARETKNLELITAYLDDSREAFRQTVLRVLNWMGPSAEPAIPKLIQLMNQTDLMDDWSQELLLTVLANVGPPAQAASPTLKSWLEKPGSKNFGGSLCAWCSVNRDDPECLERLIEVFNSTKPVITELWDDMENQLRREAVLGAFEYFPAHRKKIFPIFKSILECDEVTGCKLSVIDALLALGPPIDDLVPALRKAYKAAYKNGEYEDDLSSNYMASIVQTIHMAGVGDTKTIKWLCGILKDYALDSEIQAAAVIALGDLATGQKLAVKGLVNFVLDESEDSHLAVEALAKLGTKDPKLIKKLQGAIEDNQYAAYALLLLGVEDENAIEMAKSDLLEYQYHRDLKSARLAAQALSGLPIPPNSLIQPTVESLRAGLAAAADLLGHMGAKAKPAIPALEIAARSQDPVLSNRARLALGSIQRESRG